MKLYFRLFVIVIFSFLLISCKKETAEITGPDNAIFNNYFPNRIGTQWKYFYYDSLSNFSDAIMVKVVANTTFEENRKVKIWEYRFRTTIKKKYVETTEDTVRIYDHLNALWMNTKYILPFKVGKKWAGDFVTDSSYVIEKIPITVMASHFTESYKLKETWGALNDYGRIYTCFVPGIGVAKKHRLGRSFGLANNYWELIDYSIE
jgi:hypothetical protein